MVETFHKTCNVKHEIDIKRYGNAKSETEALAAICFGFYISITFYIYFMLHVL